MFKFFKKKWVQVFLYFCFLAYIFPDVNNFFLFLFFLGSALIYFPSFRSFLLDKTIRRFSNRSRSSSFADEALQKVMTGVNLRLSDKNIARLENQDLWLKYSMKRWEGSNHNYPSWFSKAQYNCQQEGHEYFESISDKVESDANFAKKIEQEFDLSAYDKFAPKEQDWIEMAVNAYLNRAQAMSSFKKKYKD